MARLAWLLPIMAATAGAAAVLPTDQLTLHMSSADLRWPRDTNGNPTTTKLSSWTSIDASGVIATQTTASLQPTVVENLLYCHSGVKITGGQYISVPDSDALDPFDGGFAVYAVTKQDSYATFGEAIVKGDTQSYEISHGAAGGMSMTYIWGGTYASSANTYVPYTDTTRWGVWGLHINVTSGSGAGSTKRILSTLNGDRTNWRDGNFGVTGATYTSSISSATPLYIGTPYNTYSGSIVDVLVFKKTHSLTERADVLAWLDEKYFLTCPLINSTNTQNGDVGANKAFCNGARNGDECLQTCDAGFLRSFGDSNHVCGAGEWSNAPLTCEKQCPPLVAPAYYGTCLRSIMNYDTNFPATFFDNQWRVSPAIPRSARNTAWSISSGVINANTATMPCNTFKLSSMVLDNPAWAESLAYNLQFTYEIQLSIATGRAGAVFRYVDQSNYYAVLMTSTPSAITPREVALYSVVNGVISKIANISYPIVQTMQYKTTITVKGASIAIAFDGATQFNVTNGDQRYGAIGFVVDGTATFRSMKMETDCDAGGNCLNSFPGVKCTHTCGSGYTMTSGVSARTCGWDGSSPTGDWSGTDMTCGINPPTINTTVVQLMNENSYADTDVGKPVEVYSDAARAVMAFSIVSESPASTLTVPVKRFGINSCSGQIYVNYVDDLQKLDYETQSSYDVNIQVIPNGQSGSAAFGTIKVQLKDINEAALFTGKPGPIIRTISENSLVGTALNLPVTGNDPDVPFSFRNNAYSLEVDGSSGIFIINPSTAVITVNRTGGLNFEKQSSYNLRVRVIDTVDASLTDSINVRVDLQDVNDPPLMPATQFFDVEEGEATLNTLFRSPIDMTEEDTAQTHTWTFTGGNVDPANGDTLFAFDNPSSSVVSLKWNVDRSVWPMNNVPFISNGRLCRAVYTATVRVSDGFAASSSVITVYVTANVTNGILPSVSDFKVGPGPLTVNPQTAGGETIYINGTNFKVSYTASVTFNKLDATGNVTKRFLAKNCVVSSTILIQCKTPAGSGVGLVVEVTISDGPLPLVVTPEKALLVSYQAPAVTDVFGGSRFKIDGQYWVGTLHTTGGDIVYLVGTNLGNDCADIQFHYGLYDNYDLFTGTCINATNTKAFFATGEGMIPYYLYPKITVGGQDFVVTDYQLTLGYLQPEIQYIMSYDYPDLVLPSPAYYTWGDYPVWLYFYGDNFGPYEIGGVNNKPTVRYGPSATCQNYWDEVGCPFVMGDCYKYWGADAHKIFYCQMGQSWGTNLTFVVSMEFNYYTSYSVPSHTTPKPGPGQINHMAPIISSVSGAGTRLADTAGGQDIVLQGTNLGPLSLLQDKYPNDIEVRYGNQYQFPDTPATWRLRYQYRAVGCKVTLATTAAGTMSCSSAEGTGVGHSLRMLLGGQFSAEIPNVINYGAPIVASFSGPGATDANTEGSQAVIVYGKNFGNNITLLSATYTVTLDTTTRNAFPTGTFYDVAPAQSNLTAVPVNCTYAVNHTQLLCFTREFAGGGLKWTVVVDKQTSRDPFTFYGLPTVTNITLYDPVTKLVIPYADPNGGTVAILDGRNFGRRTPFVDSITGLAVPRQFMQWMLFSPGGVPTYLRPSASIGTYGTPWTIRADNLYYVVSHNQIAIRIGAGYGSALRFTMSVMDQVAPVAGASFSYAKPVITRITPLNGTTLTTGDDPLFITIYGTNFPGPVDRASVAQIRFGNQADNSFFINGIITCVRNGFTGGPSNEQSVTCPLPGYNGLHRGILMAFNKPGVLGSVAEVADFIDPLKPFVFDFFDPHIVYLASTTVALYNNAEVSRVAKAVFPTSFNSTRVITLYGRDFGFNPGDNIGRDVFIRPIGKTAWTPIAPYNSPADPPSKSCKIGPTNIWWTHKAIVFLTNITDAEIKVVITSIDHPLYTGANLIQESNIVNITGASPSISDVSPSSGLLTEGGQQIRLLSPFGAFSTGAVMTIEIGDDGPLQAECRIKNLNFLGTGVGDAGIGSAYIDSTQSISFLIKTCTDQYGAVAITAETNCQFFCEMPPVVGGASVPMFMKKDGKLSTNALTINFQAPEIFTVKIIDATLVPSAITMFNALSNPFDPIIAPTDGGFMEIQGTNFGVCGTISIGGKNRMDTCGGVIPDAILGHRTMYVPVPKGQGSGYNDSFTGNFTKFTLSILAGEQKNVQAAGVPLAFAYMPPEVSSVSPLTGSSRGGTMITVTGRNFGQPNVGESLMAPRVHLRDVTTGYSAQECENVTRVSHYMLTCIVPAGTGGSLDLIITAGNQDGYTAPGSNFSRFTYFRPAIETVEVQEWDPMDYMDWPKNWLSVNRSTEISVSRNYSVPFGKPHSPTPGRMRVRLYGTNFGPRSPQDNCVHVLFDFAARNCSDAAYASTRYCDCLSNPSNRAACEWSYADELSEMTKFDNPAASKGFAVPVCNGLDDYPGEGEVWDDGGVDGTLSFQSRSGVDVTTGMTNLLGSGLILSWDHELIEFLMPPGAGMNILSVNTRGQMPLMFNEARFTYDAPQVTEIVRLSGEIMTGPGANDIVEIRGNNFGFGHPISTVARADLPTQSWLVTLPYPQDADLMWMYNDLERVFAARTDGPTLDQIAGQTSRPDLYRSMVSKSRRLPIADSDVASGFHTTVSWWKFCMTDAVPFAKRVDGWFEQQTKTLFSTPVSQISHLNHPRCMSRAWPDTNANHTPYTILSHSHSSIIVRPHPGWGADREGAVHIHNGYMEMASIAFNFSYSSPNPTVISPMPMYVAPASTKLLSMEGYNLGSIADRELWEAKDYVSIIVDEQEFYWRYPDPSKPSPPDSLFPSRGVVTIDLGTGNVTVGHKDVIVIAARQEGYLPSQAKSNLYIVCENGGFGRVGETCLACPITAECKGYYADIEQDLRDRGANFSLAEVYNRAHLYPEAYATYYNMNKSDVFTAGMDVNCPERIRQQFPTRDVCVVGCLPPEACLGGNRCSDGYMSKAPFFACGACAKGFYRRGLECVRCPDSPWMLVIGFVMLAVGMCVCGYILNKYNVNIAFLSIAVDYMQVISMFANSRIAWPKEIKDLLHILSAFNLNIEIIAPECIKPDLTYQEKWSGIMMLPISASFVFLSIFCGLYIWKRYVLGQRGRAFLTGHRNSLIAMFLILFYFMYLYITRSLLEVYNCISRNPDDGFRYMAAVMEQCYKPGGVQEMLIPYAIAGLTIYTAGYPLYCCYVLHTYRFNIMLDQLLRAKGTGDSEMTNPHAHAIRLRYSRLYYQYKPDLFWWMLVVILRKFFIALTSLMFRADGGFQMAVALLVLFAAYAAQVKHEPFMSPADRGLVLREHDRAKYEGGMHARLAESLKDAAISARKRTTRLDWGAPKAVLGKQILARAGLYMFNYNTVEAVMIACAILVCLSGIMFDSLAAKRVSEDPTVSPGDRTCQSKYTNYCGGLIYSVLMLISFSIIYLMVVVTVEVYGAIQEAQMARASNAKRARMARKLGIDGRGSQKGLKGALERTLSNSLKDRDPDAVAAAEAQFVSRIGVLDTAINPLFANQKVSGDTNEDGTPKVGGEGFLNATAIADMVQPPNPALWNVVRDTYRSLLEQTQQQAQQISELKRQSQIAEVNKNPRSSSGNSYGNNESSYDEDVGDEYNPRSAVSSTRSTNGQQSRAYREDGAATVTNNMYGGASGRGGNSSSSNSNRQWNSSEPAPSPKAQLSNYRPATKMNQGRKAFAPQTSRDE